MPLAAVHAGRQQHLDVVVPRRTACGQDIVNHHIMGVMTHEMLHDRKLVHEMDMIFHCRQAAVYTISDDDPSATQDLMMKHLCLPIFHETFHTYGNWKTPLGEN